jgi:hypothetical protein
LPTHAGNHDVDAHLVRASASGTRGNGATDSLEEKSDEVKGDECDGVEAWCEARQVFAICDDDTGEAEIYGC